MRKVKRINPDGTATLYRSLREASEATGYTVQSIFHGVRYGTRIGGTQWLYADGDATYHKRVSCKKPDPEERAKLRRILDALCPLLGRKEQEARQYIESHIRYPVTVNEAHRLFAQWYVHQPYNRAVLIDVAEYLRRKDAL